MSSPTVLTLYYKPKPGGFFKRILLMMNACLEAGWPVHYISLEPFPIKHERLTWHPLPCPFRKHEGLLFWSWFFLTTPWFVLWVGLQTRFDLIAIASPVYGWIVKPLKLLRRIPMVLMLLSKPAFTTGTREHYKFLAKVEHWMERSGIRSADLCLANSVGNHQGWARELGALADKIDVLPNHVEAPKCDPEQERIRLREDLNLDPETFLFTTSGVLEEHKNLEYLICAFSRIKDPDTALILFGEGPLKIHLKQVALALGIQKRVVFAGWREDASSLITGCDVFVFPSLREGMSEALLEAAAGGLPCMVSNIPENREVIPGEEQHFPVDDADTLGQMMNLWRTDPLHLARMKLATQEAVKPFVFDWKKRWRETVSEKFKNRWA